MTKKMISDVVEPYVDIDWTPVDEFMMQCEKWIELYGTNARFEFQERTYDDGEKLVITVLREETDEEYEKRLKDETDWKKYQDQKDKEEFERLKKKFGDT